MTLPAQLQKQVDEAQDILAKHYPTDDAPAPDVANAEAKNTDATPAPGAEASPPPAAATQQNDENSETYAQRWRSLQGVYNAQGRKLAETTARLESLEALIANMQTQSTAQPTDIPQTFLTDKDSTEFGTDMVDFASRAAKQEIAPLLNVIGELRSQVAHLQGLVPTVNTVAANQRASADERFFEAVSREIPNWRAVNSDPRFHEWLLSPDPMTGITRQTYLEDAQRGRDAARTAVIFNEWGRISGASQAQQTVATPNKAASDLERQVAPGRSLASAPPQPQKGRDWSPDDITKFYDDVRRGVYRGRDADKATVERDIFLAQREGRVTRKAA